MSLDEKIDREEGALGRLRGRVEKIRDATDDEGARESLDSALVHLADAQGMLQAAYLGEVAR